MFERSPLETVAEQKIPELELGLSVGRMNTTELLRDRPACCYMSLLKIQLGQSHGDRRTCRGERISFVQMLKARAVVVRGELSTSQVEVGLRVVRVDPNHFLKFSNGVARAALQQIDAAKIVVGRLEPRSKGDSFAEVLNRLVTKPLLQIAEAEQVEKQGRIGKRLLKLSEFHGRLAESALFDQVPAVVEARVGGKGRP